jgi:cold shock CspA family protein
MKLGYVQWFDISSGEGMIMVPSDKQSYYVHWSAIKHGRRPNKVLFSNEPVEVEIYENLYMKQISLVSKIEFDHSMKNEMKLAQLMNDAFEIGDTYVFDLADEYYKDDDDREFF